MTHVAAEIVRIQDQIAQCHQMIWQDMGGLDQADAYELETFLGDLAQLIQMIEKHPDAAAQLMGTEAWERDLRDLKYYAVQIKKVLPLFTRAKEILENIDDPLEEHLRNLDDIQDDDDWLLKDDNCGVCNSSPCSCGGNGGGTSEYFHRVGGII